MPIIESTFKLEKELLDETVVILIERRKVLEIVLNELFN